MIRKLFGQYELAEKALDASWLRNEVIAQNMANVDTPGYKRKTVKFEDYLNGKDTVNIKARKTRSGHVDFPKGGNDITVETEYSELSTRLDGNNVDIEYEMAEMAKNSIRYDTLIQSLNNRLRRLQSVISEGRR
jgi:flagellar basal-body rod protein FlgB